MSAVVRLCGGALLVMCTLAVPTALAASPRAGIWEGTNARGDIVTFDVGPGEGPFQGQPAIHSLQSPGAIASGGDYNGTPVRNGRVGEAGLSVRFGTATSASGRVGTPLLPFTARWVSPGRFTEIPGLGGKATFETSPGSPVRAVGLVNRQTRTLVKLNFGPLLIGDEMFIRPDPRFIRGDGRLVGGTINGVRLAGRLVGGKLYLTVVLPKAAGPALAAGTHRVTLTQTDGARPLKRPSDAELLREICKRSPGYPPCKNR